MPKAKKLKTIQKHPNRERKKHNFTFDEVTWQEFSKLVDSEGRPASRVLERLMEKYISGEVNWD